LVAKRLTDVPGSSDYFLGGVVAYSNRLKTALLDVGPALLDEHGAVSEEVAAAMAVGACKRLGADCAISTTGIAGPGGGSAEKPVGLVYVGTALGDDVQVRSFTMFRSREEIRIRTAQTALDVFRRRFLDPLDR
jgi:nicotinamide-nucleotide amidase